MHEFWLTEGGETALVTSYNIIPFDLSYPPYNVMNQQGWLTQGVFQELRLPLDGCCSDGSRPIMLTIETLGSCRTLLMSVETGGHRVRLSTIRGSFRGH